MIQPGGRAGAECRPDLSIAHGSVSLAVSAAVVGAMAGCASMSGTGRRRGEAYDNRATLLVTCRGLADMPSFPSPAERLSHAESVQAMFAPNRRPITVVHNCEAASL